MGKTITDYRKMVVRALKAGKGYSKALDLQINTLASALRTLDKTDEAIDTLEEVWVMEKTRYGEKMAPHPAFKIHKDAIDSVTRQMKILGLTADQLSTVTDEDPLAELTEALIEAGKRDGQPIMPSGDD